MSYADLGGVHLYTIDGRNDPSFSLYDKHKVCVTVTGTSTEVKNHFKLRFACGGRIMLFPSDKGKIKPNMVMEFDVGEGEFVRTGVIDFSGYTEILPMFNSITNIDNLKVYIEPSL